MMLQSAMNFFPRATLITLGSCHLHGRGLVTWHPPDQQASRGRKIKRLVRHHFFEFINIYFNTIPININIQKVLLC